MLFFVEIVMLTNKYLKHTCFPYIIFYNYSLPLKIDAYMVMGGGEGRKPVRMTMKWNYFILWMFYFILNKNTSNQSPATTPLIVWYNT